MKIKAFYVSLFCFISITANSQTNTIVTAKNSYVSENLDLNEVARIYDESPNLKDFETRLNNPGYRISNLDLNNDDKVDYLRVTQQFEGTRITVNIQSEIAPDTYEDVASINLLIQPKRKKRSGQGQMILPVISSVLDIVYKIAIIRNEFR